MQLDFSELSNCYFDITNLFAMEQLADGNTKFIMHEPRPTDALLLFVDSMGVCYQKNEPPLYVPRGSLVYLPKNSNYIWENTPALNCRGQRNLLFEFLLRRKDVYFGSKQELCCSPATNEKITFGDRISIVTTRHTGLYEKMFMELIDSFSKSKTSPLPTLCMAYDILNTVSHNCFLKTKKRTDIQIIRKSIGYLEDVACKKSIREISDECNISVGYYERLFYGYAGMTPSEYRNVYRINRIKMLLQSENITLEEIAEEMDFCDSGYLCRMFKNKTGLTPSEYRQMFLAQIQHGFESTDAP